MNSLALLLQSDSGANAAAGGIVGAILLVELAVILLIVVSLWKIFTKAGEPGWAAIVPIYNLIVLLKIVGKPAWWVILMLIPFVNIIIGIMLAINLATVFGKGVGFALGMIFLPFIFYPILAFGDARYQGPIAGGATPALA